MPNATRIGETVHENDRCSLAVHLEVDLYLIVMCDHPDSVPPARTAAQAVSRAAPHSVRRSPLWCPSAMLPNVPGRATCAVSALEWRWSPQVETSAYFDPLRTSRRLEQ